MVYADSCVNSTSRRLQAESVPAESVHKKAANKVRDFIDSLKLGRSVPAFFNLTFYSLEI